MKGERRNGIDVYTRDATRQSVQQHREFIPTISVQQPVLLEDGTAQKFSKDVKKGLKRELPRGRARFYSVVEPKNMRIVVIEQTRLLTAMREAKASPNSIQMLKLAGALRLGLQQLLEDSLDDLRLPVGQVGRFGEGKVKPAAGVSPAGWRGQRARYETRDDDDKLTPFGVIIESNNLCEQAISEHLGSKVGEIYNRQSVTPRVDAVYNQNGIHDRDFQTISSVIEEAKPDEMLLGEFVIAVRTRRNKPAMIIPLRNMEPVQRGDLEVEAA